MSASALPETEKPASFWEDFVDILYAPSRVFARRRGTGAGRVILVVMLLGAIVGAATAPLTAPLRDRQMDVAMAKARADGASEEQIAQIRGFSEGFGKVVAIVGVPIGFGVAILISALLIWLVGRLLGAPSTFGFGGAALIASYATFPTILSMLAGSALLAVLDPATLPMLSQPSLSAAPFLGRDASPIAVGVADLFSVGSIWSVIITAAGLAVIARLEKPKHWIGAAAVWGVGALVALAFAFRAAASMAA